MRIFSNLAVTLDGKIAQSDNPTKSLGTPLDRETMQKIRAKCDVILVGAGTLRAFPHCYKVKSQGLPAAKKKKLRQPANAVVTGSGNLDPNWPFWADPEVVRFVFTTQRGMASAMAAARERAFVIEAGESTIDLLLVLERLKQSGLENILVEGGGELMGEFLRERLLQELFVTLTPWLMGGEANPSLAGSTTLVPWTALKLLNSKKIRDELFLHYKVKGAKRV